MITPVAPHSQPQNRRKVAAIDRDASVWVTGYPLSREKSVPCGRHPVSSSDWKRFKPEFCCCEGLMYADRFLASRCGLEEGRDLSTERVSLSSRCVGSQAWGASFLGLPPPLHGPAPPWPRPQIGPAPPRRRRQGSRCPRRAVQAGVGKLPQSVAVLRRRWLERFNKSLFFFPFSLAPGNRRRRQAAAAAEREKATRTQTNESGGCALPCTPRRPVPPRAPGPGTTGPSVRLHGPGAMLSGGLEHA